MGRMRNCSFSRFVPELFCLYRRVITACPARRNRPADAGKPLIAPIYGYNGYDAEGVKAWRWGRSSAAIHRRFTLFIGGITLFIGGIALFIGGIALFIGGIAPMKSAYPFHGRHPQRFIGGIARDTYYHESAIGGIARSCL